MQTKKGRFVGGRPYGRSNPLSKQGLYMVNFNEYSINMGNSTKIKSSWTMALYFIQIEIRNNWPSFVQLYIC